jgi:hypothetical protein
MTFFLQRYGRSAGSERHAAETGRRSFDKLPCARITSIRFKGTFSVDGFAATNTPSECAAGLRRGLILGDPYRPCFDQTHRGWGFVGRAFRSDLSMDKKMT